MVNPLRALSDLSNWQDNYNEGDVGLISAIIARYGYNRSISVWQDGVVMAGNHTLLALKLLKEQGYEPPANIEVKDGEWYIQTTSCAHLDYEAAQDYAIADNRAAARASQDEGKLVALLKTIHAQDNERGDNRLEVIGYDPADILDLMRNAGLIGKDDGGQGAAGSELEPEQTPGEKAQAVWQIEAGDLFSVKSSWGFMHRVLCGDAFSLTDRARLLDDIEPDICHADPPYGIGLVKAGGGNVGKSQRYDAVEGDDQPFDPAAVLDWSPQVILWGANHYASRLPDSPFWLVWDKQGGAKDTTFATVELAWCNVSAPARVITHVWDGWRRDSERDETRYHANQKPIAVIVWALEWLEGFNVFEPFGGSGTTLLACEQINRRCLLMDNNPLMIAATLARLEAAGLVVAKLP